MAAESGGPPVLAATAQVVVAGGRWDDPILETLGRALRERFPIRFSAAEAAPLFPDAEARPGEGLALTRPDRKRLVLFRRGGVRFVQLGPATALANWRGDLVTAIAACNRLLGAAPEELVLTYESSLESSGRGDDPLWIFRSLPEARETGWALPGAPASFILAPRHPGHRLEVRVEPVADDGSVALQTRDAASLVGRDPGRRLDEAHANLVSVFQRLLTERLRVLIGPGTLDDSSPPPP